MMMDAFAIGVLSSPLWHNQDTRALLSCRIYYLSKLNKSIMSLKKNTEKMINDGALQSTPYIPGSAALFPDLIACSPHMHFDHFRQDIKTARRTCSFSSRLKPAAHINTATSAGRNASRWPPTNTLRAARLKSIQTECPVLNSREIAWPLFQETFRKCERLRVTGHAGEISTARSGRMWAPGGNRICVAGLDPLQSRWAEWGLVAPWERTGWLTRSRH